MDHRRQQRRGAATVELAICLPLFVIVVMGTVQSCELIHLSESLCVAAYEAARLAAKGETNRQQAIDQAEAILSSRGILNSTVQIEPDDLTSIGLGEPVTVTTSVLVSDQTWLPPLLVGSAEITGQTIMVKEIE
jgi:Flp pilus assembly protein TadG